MTNKHAVSAVTAGASSPDADHHGDIRKVAYLRRRAAYQTQSAGQDGYRPGGSALPHKVNNDH